MPPTYRSHSVEHLGLVAGMFAELGIAAVKDDLSPLSRPRMQNVR